ncbi:MAG: hypothetical protein ACKO5E_15175 [bacterium]
MKKQSGKWFIAALAMGFAAGSASQVHAGGGLFGKGSSKAAQTGQPAGAKHDAVSQTAMNVGDSTPEGTVVSVTPIYPRGEEPGKASFDGGKQDHGHGLGTPASVTAEPSPIGVVQTNFNRSNPPLPAGVSRDVMAHGAQAGAMPPGMMPPGMMPQGMMPPGMTPPGQTPGMGMKPPRRGLLGALQPKRSAAQDPYAVFHMNARQRAMHASTPIGPQAAGPVSSLPASAVYGQKPAH